MTEAACTLRRRNQHPPRTRRSSAPLVEEAGAQGGQGDPTGGAVDGPELPPVGVEATPDRPRRVAGARMRRSVVLDFTARPEGRRRGVDAVGRGEGLPRGE